MASSFGNKLVLAFVLERAMADLMLWLCRQPDQFDEILVPILKGALEKRTPREDEAEEAKFYLSDFEDALKQALKDEYKPLRQSGKLRGSWEQTSAVRADLHKLRSEFRNRLAHGSLPTLSDDMAAATMAAVLARLRAWVEARMEATRTRRVERRAFDSWRYFHLSKEDLLDILQRGKVASRRLPPPYGDHVFYRRPDVRPTLWVDTKTVNQRDDRHVPDLKRVMRVAWAQWEDCSEDEVAISFVRTGPAAEGKDVVAAPFWRTLGGVGAFAAASVPRRR